MKDAKMPLNSVNVLLPLLILALSGWCVALQAEPLV